MKILKYDIIKVNLNPKKGHTQAGIRPCIVIQSNIFNKYGGILLVVPLTKVEKDIFPSEFWIQSSEINGLNIKSRFLGSQIMTIDKEFVLGKLGTLEEKYHDNLKEAIIISLDLENIY